MSESIAFSNIKTLKSLLDSGEIGAVEVTKIFAERISLFNQSCKAFISLDIENALRRAQQLDQIAERKLLSGITYACKDLFDVKGIITTGGSRVLQNNVAGQDAACITRMHNAGAIFLGKNNLHEFAYGATGENTVYGTPPNPYDQTRLAGGSSSGSVVAVANGLCCTALGTDTGGSVRAPAALCGLTGFKPTYGRISTEGVIPYSWTLDHVGSITRSVEDAALVFAALDNQLADKSLKLNNLRIGIPETFFFENADSEILASVEQFMQLLARAGATLKKVAMPSMEYTRTVSLTVQMPEALSYHNRYLESRGELYSPDFR
ncbi:MAG: amidase, partial [Gammaproteobacteria bacterium]|nr:amidase [Gammaproteobacteria bacterium]